MEQGIYKHFKCNKYELLYIAKHSETLEDMVVYKALYGEGGVWVRPLSMWEEMVEYNGKMVKRFESVEINNDLLINLDKLHTTQLGIERIKKNLDLDNLDVVTWCNDKIKNADRLIRKGKNYYAYFDNIVITINGHSFTIITAHKNNVKKMRFN